MKSIADLIGKLRREAGLTQTEFAEIFDIKDKKGKASPDKVWTYEHGKANVPITVIEKLSNALDMYHGELDRIEEFKENELKLHQFRKYIEEKRKEFKEKEDAEMESRANRKSWKDIDLDKPSSLEEFLEPYIKRRQDEKNKSNPYMVPLIPIKAQAGYVRAMDQEIFIDTLEQYALPPGVNPQGAVWRYWEVEGDSMEPAFHSGDIILTSQVHRLDWENLRNFYLYVIVTEERVLFKRLYCKNDLEWVLISENEDMHPQQLISIEAIKEVWVYRRSIINKAPPTKMFEIKV